MFRVQVCGIFAVRLIQELTRSGSFGEDYDGARHSDPTRTSKVCPMPCGHSCVAALGEWMWTARQSALRRFGTTINTHFLATRKHSNRDRGTICPDGLARVACGIT